MFCPTCGVNHHAADEAAEAAADREVTLAKINADRDVKIAQINASVTRDTAEIENTIDLARAEGKTQGMETVLESGAVDGQAEELAEPGEPIVVEAPAEDPAPTVPDMAPPEVIETSSPSSSSRSSGGGWWDGYGR